MDKSRKIVITGGAGLAGQNLVLDLKEKGYTNLVVLDKHDENLAILAKLHPTVKLINQDISQPGAWQDEFKDAACVVMLHAQIAGLTYEPFERNNLDGTRVILDLIKLHKIEYLVYISSSVVLSKSNDFYTVSKKEQEKMVRESGVKHCTLRPTLMFGWFDPKHLGWLARLMEKTPVFPIPGKGDFLRQPLYVRDFVRVIEHCIQTQPEGDIYDLVGPDEINYIDIIKEIRRVRKLNLLILPIPYNFFKFLLKAVALVHPKPPFTAQQLDALSAGDYFRGVDFEKTFGFKATHFIDALKETWSHPDYSNIVLKSPH